MTFLNLMILDGKIEINYLSVQKIEHQANKTLSKELKTKLPKRLKKSKEKPE